LDDLYKILGVKPNATADEIRERYHFLAQAFHPDKFSSLKQKRQAEEEFKLINSAYQILSIPEKRKRYDNRVRSTFPSSLNKTANNKKRQSDDTLRRAEEETSCKRSWEATAEREAARRRFQEDLAKREEQKRRSKEWIIANFANQKRAKLRGVDLRNTGLMNSNYEGANFEEADLSYSNLSGAFLCCANMVKVDLSNSKLIYSFLGSLNNFEPRGADLTMANLRKSDFRRANLHDVNFTNAIMEKANFANASLINANLTGADLRDANLTEANLAGANLTNTKLIGTNLQKAELTEADLSKAIIENANFEGVSYAENTLWPNNFNPQKAGAILTAIFYDGILIRNPEIVLAEQREHEKNKKKEIDDREKTWDHLNSCFSSETLCEFEYWSDFTLHNEENKRIGVNLTGCTTIELIGSEEKFHEIILRTDYLNEIEHFRYEYLWKYYLFNLVRKILENNDIEVAYNWLSSQCSMPKKSILGLEVAKVFGHYLLTFRPKYNEGIFEWSIKRATP